MLPTASADYRRSSTDELLTAIARGDALALAEAYHRTAGAAYACARRLLHTREEVEAALRAAYLALWEEAPEDVPLEAWVRHRVFVEGRAHLRDSGKGAASPSATLLLRDAPMTEAALDRTEQLIAALDDDALRALLLAHDRGIPTVDQRGDSADEALRRALFALAEADDPGDCQIPGMADLVLGLLGDTAAGRVKSALAADSDCGEVARTLRRGRRRIEGLPPPPDLGHRVIAAVLHGSATAPATPAPPEPGQPAAPTPGHDTPTPAVGGPGAGPAVPTDINGAGAPAPESASPASAIEGDAPSALGAEDEQAAASALDDVEPDAPRPADRAGRPAGEAAAATDEAAAQEAGEAFPAAPPEIDGAAAATADTAPAEEPGPGWPASQAPVGQPAPADVARKEPSEATQTPATAQARSSWSRGTAVESSDDDALRFESLDEPDDEGGRGRRALTTALTVIGALLLLAAGAAAGLLAIRIFLG